MAFFFKSLRSDENWLKLKMLHGEKTDMITNENTPSHEDAPVFPFITIRECYVGEYLWQCLCHCILLMIM